MVAEYRPLWHLYEGNHALKEQRKGLWKVRIAPWLKEIIISLLGADTDPETHYDIY